METMNKAMQESLTPFAALEKLKEGNSRFVNNVKVSRDLLEQVSATKEGQYPLAVILSCIDSRTSAELIFDQGIGDIFSIRVAGNVLNDDVLGSMEFACKVAGTKVVVVMGHTHCGAIQGAIDGARMGHLTQLLQKLNPAIKRTMESNHVKIHGAMDIGNLVAENNVYMTITKILDKSEILRTMVSEGRIGVVGAMYDIETGMVDFYEEDMRMKQKEVVANRPK